ncbi:ADP-ribosylglycohydrolase family protein [Bacteroidota bacterium]
MNFKSVISILLFILSISVISTGQVKMSKETLKDKIKGGWAAQTIGCTFGGPTEFRNRSSFIHDYQPIHWSDGVMKWWYDNVPGLYDDIYMDLTFVDVFEKKGFDAPASDFAKAFANAEYMLWHANQAARYNILNGIMPPESGHWLNNPHADDIDYQIEADFAGLMNPGMPNSASEVSDKIGHIMNYGDGWYGGVYVGAMYSIAFISDDVNYIVEEALKAIPKESKYHKVISDVIKWYKENPDDWKETWFNVQKKWGEDIGCPDGVFTSFNIDATINSAWVVLGLLYGQGDLGKTLSVSTRAGDDSDCNPATAGGILGTMLGYNNIPEYWKQGLAEVEPLDFSYTTMSLNDVYELSYNHALAMIEKNGGSVTDDEVEIKMQEIKPVKLEVGFEGHFPVEREWQMKEIEKEFSFDFEGIGFAITGEAEKQQEDDYTFETELYVDKKLISTSSLPTNYTTRKNTLFWKYQLPIGKHNVRIVILNPTDKAVLNIGYIVIYNDKPVNQKY